ncbi:MAG: response regulator [Chloroflexota bacterium]
MRVLIVDDNNDIRELVRQVLLVEGHEVVIAKDGLEALQQEARTQPDLVICDVNLPIMDGWEVCQRIKVRRSVPILLLTVRAEIVDIEHSRDVGADDHLPKPFEITEFLKRVNTLLHPKMIRL